MSAPRFKSKDDYFSKRSTLTERVIQKTPPVKRKPSSRAIVPVPLMEQLFCSTVESFEIEGEGRFDRKARPLEDAIVWHLDGDATVLVNPLDRHGMTAWHILPFSLSDAIDHPFSKAREFAEALDRQGIPSLLEVTEGGKGHYHLWVLHEQPVEAAAVAAQLRVFGAAVMGYEPTVIPGDGSGQYIPLPLQYESVLLQRRVFVNTVGKKIKDQRALLEQAEHAPRAAIEALGRKTETTGAGRKPRPDTPSREKIAVAGVSPAVPAKPAPSSRTVPASPVPVPKTNIPMPRVAKTPVAPADVPAVPITAEAPSAPISPEPKHVPDSTLVSVVRFRYGDNHFAIPAGSVSRVMAWHEENGRLLPGGTATVDGMALPVIIPGVFGNAAGGEMQDSATLLVVNDGVSRLLIPVDRVDGIIRVTLGHAPGNDPQLLGSAVFGETTIAVLDPTRLRKSMPRPGAKSVAGTVTQRQADRLRYLVVSLAGKRLAVETSGITEILAGSAVRRIPESGGEERVVAECHGVYVPVIELAGLRGNAPKPMQSKGSPRIVVISGGKERAGLYVDDVIGFETVPASDIRALPQDAGSWCCGAIERRNGDPILIVDAGSIL